VTSRSLDRRLHRDARRGQLVQAGRQLARTTPFDQISPDAVARAVGVSKALVFHYFPTKRHLQVAIVRDAAAELLARLDIDNRRALPPEEGLRSGLDAFVSFIEEQPQNYLAIARSAGSDPQLLAVFEETRNAIVAGIVESMGVPGPPAGLTIMIRGWIAMVEEAILHWLEDTPVPREELIGFLQRAAVTMLPDALATFSTPPAGTEAAS
jgi:AcrR family transcriptional regulator